MDALRRPRTQSEPKIHLNKQQSETDRPIFSQRNGKISDFHALLNHHDITAYIMAEAAALRTSTQQIAGIEYDGIATLNGH